VLDGILQELAPDIVHVTHLVNHTAALLEATARRAVPTIATFTDFFGFCYNNRLEAHTGELCAGPSRTAVNCLACHLKAASGARRGLRDAIAAKPFGAGITASALYAMQRFPGARAGRIAGLVQDVVQRPRILGALYQHYRAAIAPTAFIQHAYERNGFARPMTRIHFGVDLDRSPKPVHARKLKLGFIGQIMSHKGPDILVQAARAALRDVDYEILIYGTQSQDPRFTAELEQAAAGMPVRLCGTFPRERMREVLDDLDFVVIPSRWYENSPLVLLNALATHTPVIVSDVEGMTEFVTDDVNGFVFERGSVASLARVLARIAREPGVGARLAATTHYDMTPRTMAERTVGVYERVLAEAAR
jgi:glycosyltransferase involved in cell wall biosynthesis